MAFLMQPCNGGWQIDPPSMSLNEWPSNTGHMREWVSLADADLIVGEWTTNQLARFPKLLPVEGAGRLVLSSPRKFKEGNNYKPEIRDVDPITWQRRMLFVKDQNPEKPNYFLFRDNIDTELPSDWNI